MSDRDKGSAAWRVTPAEYMASRGKGFGIPRDPISVYVPMRDGCRLAVDVYLPKSKKDADPGARFPAILIFTPYYRRFKLSEPGAEPTPNAAKYRDAFVPCGYALVVIDVRGTGASFGTRDSLAAAATQGCVPLRSTAPCCASTANSATAKPRATTKQQRGSTLRRTSRRCLGMRKPPRKGMRQPNTIWV